jgi:hypothetical protein
MEWRNEMTGAYLRVKRGDKFENIEVEHLTDGERIELLSGRENIMDWMNLVCTKLAEADRLLQSLVDEGILERAER